MGDIPLREDRALGPACMASCGRTGPFALAAGGTIVFQEHFDAAGLLELIQREGVTWTPLVATMFQRILSLPDWERFDTSSLQGVLFGGAALPLDMVGKLKRLARTVVGCWGMTETTGAVTFTDPGDSPE